jgi:hypothetical protein
MDWEGRDFDDFAQDLRPPSPPHPLEPAEGWAGTRSVLSDPRLAAILSTPQGFPDFQNSQLAELLDFENRVAAELAIRRRELQEAMNPWFGELALLVQDPQAYPLVVEKLVRAEDLQQSDLAEIVNPQLAMVVTLAFQKSRLREATIKNPGKSTSLPAP